MSEEMVIVVDGLEETVPAGSTLAQLIERFEAGHKDLLVELDGRFVHPGQYKATRVKPGQRVEFILPAFGG